MSKEVEDCYKSTFKPEIELLEGKLKKQNFVNWDTFFSYKTNSANDLCSEISLSVIESLKKGTPLTVYGSPCS